jgi:membrane associated rhomboid family serine protease
MHDDFSNIKKRRPRRMGGRSMVLTLIFINFALWLANGLLFNNNDLTRYLLLEQRLEVADKVAPGKPAPEQKPVSFSDPRLCYRYITYGFAHSPTNWMHVVFNMLGLLMFGYGMMLGIGPGGFGFVRGDNVENRLGSGEFLAFYLLTILVGGILFALTNLREPRVGCLGASGGVAGVVILYAWLYPRKTLFLYGIIPLPMWAIGVLIVFMDAAGATGRSEDGIAYSVHLAGAAIGTLYYFLFLKQGLTLTGWLDRGHTERKPKLRVHEPKDSAPKSPLADEEFSRRLDEILKRYGDVGESGLTAEEREFLQHASRRFAEKRHRR